MALQKLNAQVLEGGLALDDDGNMTLTGNLYATDVGDDDAPIEDFYVSEDSIWIGDQHKVQISSDGKMKFRKRKTTTVPAVILAAGGDEAGALTHSDKSSLSELKKKHWRLYARSLGGSLASAKNKDIFRDNKVDYQQESNADVWQVNDTGEIHSSVNVGIGNADPVSSLHITGTDSLILPVGTTAQRGTATQGALRYNTTTSGFEGYNGTEWGALGGGGLTDEDEDTYITAELTADVDALDFYTAGTARMHIINDGAVAIGKAATSFNSTGVSLECIDGLSISSTTTNPNIYLDNQTTNGKKWTFQAESGDGALTCKNVTDNNTAFQINTSGQFLGLNVSGTITATGGTSSNWNTAYGWGDHASGGYLTSQTSHADVVVDGDFTSNGLMKRTGAGAYSISTDNTSNWNTAYGWGNHASAGYATSGGAWTTTGNDIYYTTGNVGIGETSPGSRLHVKNTTASATLMQVEGSNGVALSVSDDYSGDIFTVNTSSGNAIIQAKNDYTLNLNPGGNGNVGIGTSSSTDHRLQIKKSGSGNQFLRLETDGTHGIKPEIQFDSGLGGTNRVRKTVIQGGYDSGQGGSGGFFAVLTNNTSESLTTALTIDSSQHMYVTGDVTSSASDERLKENIEIIENAVDKIKTLNGVRFNWNKNVEALGFMSNQETEVGVIAQQVKKVLPEAVTIAPFDRSLENKLTSKSGENYLTVKYEKIVPLLIEAIKEQQVQIDELIQAKE